MLRTIRIKSEKTVEFIDIRRDIEARIEYIGIDDGICYLFVQHTTAGVTVNESADPSVVEDLCNWLDRSVPSDLPYLHVEGNSSAHIKAALIGTSVAVPVKNGELNLGRWQGVFLAEFDGPRTRQIQVQLISG